MKSVLFINYEYPPVGAGAANATWHFANGIAKRGIRTSVLTSAFGRLRGTMDDEGVTVHRIGACRRHQERSSLFQMICFTVSACIRLPRILAASRPDMLIVFFSIPCGPVGLYARVLRHIPYILMLRGGDVPGSDFRLHRYHRFLKPLRRLLYRKSSAIVANSGSLREIAAAADRDFTYAVTPNGVDTSYFTPHKHGIRNGNPYTFLYSGRVCPQKNLDLAISALAHCRSNGIDCRLTVAGDGPDRNRLASLAHSLSVDDHISWQGWQNRAELRDLYHASDCLINPSRNEGHPNAVLEAMACGLPVIASDCAGNRDCVTDGNTGLLFKTGDCDDLIKKMTSLVQTPAAGRAMGHKGSIRCRRYFSWETATAHLVTIITRAEHEYCAL